VSPPLQVRGVGGGPRPEVGQSALTGQLALADAEDQLGRETEPDGALAAEAATALDKVAIGVGSVRVDPRGTVISLPAGALFVPNRTTLLPAAEEKLNLIAAALRGQRGRSIAIEGFTDSQGNESSNRQFSQARADAILAYLVSRGLSASDIRSRGMGGIRPIADNGSMGGRARNHRIEIVVESKEKQ
jgi:outer membrane protein OmpA-like peptidoglycan-associated protein